MALYTGISIDISIDIDIWLQRATMIHIQSTEGMAAVGSSVSEASAAALSTSVRWRLKAQRLAAELHNRTGDRGSEPQVRSLQTKRRSLRAAKCLKNYCMPASTWASQSSRLRSFPVSAATMPCRQSTWEASPRGLCQNTLPHWAEICRLWLPPLLRLIRSKFAACQTHILYVRGYVCVYTHTFCNHVTLGTSFNISESVS